MDSLLFSCLLIALIGGIVDLDSTATWQFMISQPLVAAPLTGLFLGALHGDFSTGLKLGLVVGSILQLVWVEKLPLGMNVPPDAALASVLSVALGFLAGRDFELYTERSVCATAALLLSVALGLLGRSLDMFVRRINTNLDGWVCRQIENERIWALSVGHTIGGFLTFVKAFLFCFLVSWFGVEPLRYFTRTLSFNQATGFIVIQGLLPAIGFAVLASMCVKNKKELQWCLIGAGLFTLLPASVWLGLGAALFISWNESRARHGGAK